MIATTLLSVRPPILLAADLLSLSIVGGLAIQLVKAPINNPPSTDPFDYTLADFTGSGALTVSSTGGVVTLDPLTGNTLVLVKDPAGGWRWVATNIVNLPQTIFGYVLTDPAITDIYAAQSFDIPIPLSLSGQGVVIGQAGVQFLNGFLNSPT